MTSAVDLDRGRTAYAAHRWNDAMSAWADADQAGVLLAVDLEQFATAALLTGQEAIGIDLATRAHEAFLAAGDVAGAARSASWIGIYLMGAGDLARSAGWLARAQRVFQAIAEPNPVEGLLLIPVALGELNAGNPEAAAGSFDEAFAIADQFRDLDLMALAQLGQGQAKIMLGELSDGLGLLDEVMVAVTAGEISPVPSGIVYCGVIGSCHLAFDLRRAHEWTTALDHWCGGRPDMVLFTGTCQMHRAQLYFLHGEWAEALAAARSALDRAGRGARNSIAEVWYLQGEVQRICGDFDAAEESFRQANQAGFEPEPGLALLRLAQGKPELAQSLIRRALDGVDLATRRQRLPGMVEIALATGSVAGARDGADELTAMAEADALPMAKAIADQWEGAVLLAEDDARRALTSLRRSWRLWQDLDAPYEAARCRVLAARACRALGDDDSAMMELEAARAVFAELGAAVALAEVVTWSRSNSEDAASSLTPREVEVLRLVSTGKTNRAVAAELYLSEKTVARHLSNLFMKLGLSSRSAATAYAYEHGLV